MIRPGLWPVLYAPTSTLSISLELLILSDYCVGCSVHTGNTEPRPWPVQHPSPRPLAGLFLVGFGYSSVLSGNLFMGIS